MSTTKHERTIKCRFEGKVVDLRETVFWYWKQRHTAIEALDIFDEFGWHSNRVKVAVRA